jgi:hypothetical protein
VREAARSIDESVGATEIRPASVEDDGAVSWPDDSAESSYLAEARERGEAPVAPAPSKAEEKDHVDPKSLPSLEELVQRIPSEVRDVLDDLFRAKFTKVRRIPRGALKE